MKKSTIVIIAFALIYVVCALVSAFEPNLIDPSIKSVRRPQNVCDEIWNLFVAEWQGETTLLTTATKNAEFRDYKSMITLSMPEGDAYLWWSSSSSNKKEDYEADVIWIRVWDSKGEEYGYFYDTYSKEIRSEDNEKYLREFLMRYFQWCEESDDFSSSFSPDDLGTYTFRQGQDLSFD